MRRTGSTGAAAAAVLFAVGAGVAPAHAADAVDQLQLTPSTISVYDDLEVRFPGCSARARGSQAVAASWDAGVDPLTAAGGYGYDSLAGDTSATRESARQPWAYTAGPGTYTITGACVTVEGRTIAYGSAMLTVQHSDHLPAGDDAWAMVPGRNVLSSKPEGTGFRLVAQADGHLVQYSPSGVPVWYTGVHGPGVGPPVMQADGNLVIRRGDTTAWSSNTAGNPGARLVVQGDGNLVIYSRDGRPLWWTWDGVTLPAGRSMPVGLQLTSPNRQVRLVPQGDGNLVLYGPRGALWHSGTRGSNVRLTMQTDGNLVLYDGAGAPLWFSGQRPGAARLVVQSDGNLVLYNADNRPLWWTGTRV